MESSNGVYAFPVLKNQTLLPSLTFGSDPVGYAALRWTRPVQTIYPRGSVQLTATVDAANGASRAVTWTSSNPAKGRGKGRIGSGFSGCGKWNLYDHSHQPVRMTRQVGENCEADS